MVALGALVVFAASDFVGPVMFLIGSATLFGGIYAVRRRQRNALALLLVGASIFAGSTCFIVFGVLSARGYG
jgi:hypothetical protein